MLAHLAHPRTYAAFVLVLLSCVTPFNQFQLFNLNSDAINTTVLTAVGDSTRFQTFNPFTERPVQGVHWDFDERFGEPINAEAYTLPRTFQFAVGFRF